MAEFSTFTHVLTMCGVAFNAKSVEIRDLQCPNCGKKALNVNLKKDLGYCFKCETRFNYQSYYMMRYNVSAKDAYKDIMQYEGKSVLPSRQEEKKYFDEIKTVPEAPIEFRNEVNRLLIDQLSLSERHKTDLYNRGFDDERLERLKYRTFKKMTLSERKDLAKRIVAMVKQNIYGEGYGVPGFYEEKDGSPALLPFMESILVPYRDRNNNIAAFQCRVNNELLTEDFDSKYLWLSSKKYKNSALAKPICHYACDFSKDFRTGEIKPILKNEVRLTEGGMKADLIHYFSGEPVLAIAGVKTIDSFIKEIEFLKSQGVTTIIDTFDMDYITNDDVAKWMGKLKEAVEGNGLLYKRIDWDSSYKGYDDYLYAKSKEDVI